MKSRILKVVPLALLLLLASASIVACTSGSGSSSSGGNSLVDANGHCTEHYIQLTKDFTERVDGLLTGSLEDANKANQECSDHLAKSKGVRCTGIDKETGEEVNGVQEQIERTCSSISALRDALEEEATQKSNAVERRANQDRENARRIERLVELGCTSTSTLPADYWTCKRSPTFEEAREKLGLLTLFCSKSDWYGTNYLSTQPVCQDANNEVVTFGHELSEVAWLKAELERKWGVQTACETRDTNGESDRNCLAGLIKLNGLVESLDSRTQKYGLHTGTLTIFIGRTFRAVGEKKGVLEIDAAAPAPELEHELRGTGRFISKK